MIAIPSTGGHHARFAGVFVEVWKFVQNQRGLSTQQTLRDRIGYYQTPLRLHFQPFSEPAFFAPQPDPQMAWNRVYTPPPEISETWIDLKSLRDMLSSISHV